MKEIIIIAIVLAVFLISTYLSVTYAENLRGLVAISGTAGMFFYFLITTLAVILAPVSTLPLLPLAVALWGSFTAAIITILGWQIGAMVAFTLAQKYGHPLLHKLTDSNKIDKIRRMIPEQNLFLTVIVFRIVLPVDVLSYALGLLTNMRFLSYSVATLIGITPFAFAFSYAIKLPILYQMTLIVIGLIILYFGYKHWFKGFASER